ncbi:MAG: AMP-binding enzyme [Syntrophales bacterium]
MLLHCRPEKRHAHLQGIQCLRKGFGRSHGQAPQCAVVGPPDAEAGEIPVAFVVLKAGERTTAEELLDYCAQNVAPYKKIRQIIFKRELPISRVGKILKKELRDELTQKEETKT